MTGDRPTAVALRDVSFAYGRHPVLRGVDLDILAGDFVSIIGPNGGGKSTLLKLMLGLLVPDRGTVRVLDTTPERARLRVGYMPQHAHVDPQFPVTAMDVVLMGRLGRRPPLGPFTARDREAAREALADTEALPLADRPFSELSGGQRQRVLIARALACEPELLLLDEPTASLDPGIQDDLYELLRRLNERMTLALVSHDVSVVSRHVSQVICVNVSVVQHPATALEGELAKLFPSESGVRLVRHDHHHHPERRGT
jgi:zinc transport system ATP-binding protein